MECNSNTNTLEAKEVTGFTKAAVQRAEAELKRARELYDQVRNQAKEHVSAIREKKVGDAVGDLVEVVRKNPMASLAVIGIAGFVLGRLFKR